MDRLPSSHHDPACPCPGCRVAQLADRLDVRLSAREVCHGYANACPCEACRARAARKPAPRSNVVAFPGKPRFAAARMKDAA